MSVENRSSSHPVFYKQIGRAVIYSNIYVSFAAALFAIETNLLFDFQQPDFYLAFFVFFSTLTTYNFQRLARYDKRPLVGSDYHKWIIANYSVLITLTVFSLLASLVTFFLFLNLHFLILLIPVGLISFWYSVNFHAFGLKIPGLRTIPYVKIIPIAVVWATVTVGFPILKTGDFRDVLGLDTALFFLQRLLFIFVITLPFDIRDMKYDKQNNLKTIPLFFGVEKTKAIALVVLICFFLLVILHYFLGNKLELPEAFALLISGVVTGFVVSKTNERRQEYFYSVIMDGMIILQFLLVLAASNIQAFTNNG